MPVQWIARLTLPPVQWYDSPMNPIDFGKFRLLEKIGQGGMAEVFYAHIRGQEGFTKEVALKRVLQHLCEDADFVKSFIDEARLGGLLNHHHIVQTLDFGQEQGVYYLAMEYVHGLTLREVINFHNKSRQPMPPTIVMELLLQFCDGLRYAHKAEDELGNPLMMVHRDLKPTNILVSSYGAVKIADFGIARAETNLRRTTYDGVLKGTAQYMSPEQALGDLRIDQRSDIFSAGSIAYEMVTLRSLFYDPSNSIKTLRNVQDANIADPLATMVRDFSYTQRLAPLLEWMLQRDPANRPAQIDDVMQEMRRLQSTLPRQIDTQTWIEQVLVGLGKPVRSRRSTASRVSIPVVPPGTALPGAGPSGAGAGAAALGPGSTGSQAPVTRPAPGTSVGLPVGPGIAGAPGGGSTATPARPNTPAPGGPGPLQEQGPAFSPRAVPLAAPMPPPGVGPATNVLAGTALPGAVARTSVPADAARPLPGPTATSAAPATSPPSPSGFKPVPVAARAGVVLVPPSDTESTSFSLELDEEEEGARTIAQPTLPTGRPGADAGAGAPPFSTAPTRPGGQGTTNLAGAGAARQGNIERVVGGGPPASPFAAQAPVPPSAQGIQSRTGPMPSGPTVSPSVRGGSGPQGGAPVAGSLPVPIPVPMPAPVPAKADRMAGMNLPPPRLAQEDDWSNVATTAINLSDAPPGFLQGMVPPTGGSGGMPEQEAVPIRPGSGRAALAGSAAGMGRGAPSVPQGSANLAQVSRVEPSAAGRGGAFELPPPSAGTGEWADIRTRALSEGERLAPAGARGGFRADATIPDPLGAFVEADNAWRSEPPHSPHSPLVPNFPNVPTSVVSEGRGAADRAGGAVVGAVPPRPPVSGGFSPPQAATVYMGPSMGPSGHGVGPSGMPPGPSVGPPVGASALPPGFSPAQAPARTISAGMSGGPSSMGAARAGAAPGPAPGPVHAPAYLAPGPGGAPSGSMSPGAYGSGAMPPNAPAQSVRGGGGGAGMFPGPAQGQGGSSHGPGGHPPVAPPLAHPQVSAQQHASQQVKAPQPPVQVGPRKMPLWAIGALLLLLVAVGLVIGFMGAR